MELSQKFIQRVQEKLLQEGNELIEVAPFF